MSIGVDQRHTKAAEKFPIRDVGGSGGEQLPPLVVGSLNFIRVLPAVTIKHCDFENIYLYIYTYVYICERFLSDNFGDRFDAF